MSKCFWISGRATCESGAVGGSTNGVGEGLLQVPVLLRRSHLCDELAALFRPQKAPLSYLSRLNTPTIVEFTVISFRNSHSDYIISIRNYQNNIFTVGLRELQFRVQKLSTFGPMRGEACQDVRLEMTLVWANLMGVEGSGRTGRIFLVYQQ